MFNLSVIICTYNRNHDLMDLLHCLSSQETTGAFTHEIIVVDNNSKDQTRSTVESYKEKFQGRLRYFFEPQQGKTYALNLGIKEAQGEFLVFIDDDCLVEKNYLLNIYEAFQKYGPEIGVLGGRIEAHWTGGSKPPQWFIDLKPDSELKVYFNGPLGILDYGNSPFLIDFSKKVDKNGHFYGANMCIQKKALDRTGYFDTKMTVGEDTEICLRLFRSGVKGLYVPQIIVYHKINVQKVTPRYYYRWFYLRGQYQELNKNFKKKFFYPFGIPLWFIKQNIYSYLKSFLERDQHRRIYSRCMVFCNLGVMRRLARGQHA